MPDAADRRIFVSYAAPDEDLAKALIDFLRLGCDLNDSQIFSTARPGSIPAGVQFGEVIREALEAASMTILLLTPTFYESRFCLAETGAVWTRETDRIPLLVPPIDYHDLEGVQLGEQALQINSSGDLDQVRDEIAKAVGSGVATGRWNDHKNDFLNRWEIEFDGNIPSATAVPLEEHAEVARRLEISDRKTSDLHEDVERLRRFVKELKGQNDVLREQVPDPPPAPELEGDETAQWIADAEAAISTAQKAMAKLPPIVCEAMFQSFHGGNWLTVGGFDDAWEYEIAQREAEEGYLSWLEDPPNTVTVRREQPLVDAADTALREVREIVFGGDTFSSSSVAPSQMRPLLRDKYGIEDPTFELRPVWKALDLI